MKFKALIVFFLVFVNSTKVFSEESDTTRRINDMLFHYGQLTYTADFYGVNSRNSFLEHNFVFQPFLKDKNILTFEMGITNSWLSNGNFTIPADMAIIYQRNFKSGHYGENGYQGFALRAKQVIPTGRDEFYSGFDTWAIEPLVGIQFLFGKTHFSASFSARYWHSYAALHQKKKRNDHLRIEPGFGYERKHFWVNITPDYRYIPNNKSSNLFLEMSAGYKISDNAGLSVLYKSRLSGTDFFEYNAAFSFYFNL